MCPLRQTPARALIARPSPSCWPECARFSTFIARSRCLNREELSPAHGSVNSKSGIFFLLTIAKSTRSGNALVLHQRAGVPQGPAAGLRRLRTEVRRRGAVSWAVDHAPAHRP